MERRSSFRSVSSLPSHGYRSVDPASGLIVSAILQLTGRTGFDAANSTGGGC